MFVNMSLEESDMPLQKRNPYELPEMESIDSLTIHPPPPPPKSEQHEIANKSDSDDTPSESEPEEEPNTPKDAETLQKENTALRARLKQLQHDLHDAQDFVFSLQPRQQGLTEAEASEDFMSLCAAVEDWVDQKLGNAIEDHEIENGPNIRDARALMDLIPQPGKNAFLVAGTDVDNLQAAVLRYLCDSIFSQDFYCPLPKDERDVVTTVERAMRQLRPKRDLRTIRNWRIETYTALSARPEFQRYAGNRTDNLSTELYRLIRLFTPPNTDPKKLIDSFTETIAKPACALARKMHLAFDEFSLEWSPYHDLPHSPTTMVEGREVVEQCFDSYEFVDVTTRKTLKERPGEGCEVRWLFDLRPRLSVRKLRADAWGEGKTLVRSKVLIAVVKEREVKRRERKMAMAAQAAAAAAASADTTVKAVPVTVNTAVPVPGETDPQSPQASVGMSPILPVVPIGSSPADATAAAVAALATTQDEREKRDRERERERERERARLEKERERVKEKERDKKEEPPTLLGSLDAWLRREYHQMAERERRHREQQSRSGLARIFGQGY